MGWTKQELVDAAFEEIGLPPYTFSIQPEQYQMAMRRMDSMVAEWTERGLQIGYIMESGLNEDSGVALNANSAVYLQLAMRIAPTFGKAVSNESKLSAIAAMDGLWIGAAIPEERQMPGTMPRGQGQRPWRTNYWPFFGKPNTSPITAPKTDDLDIAKD